MLPFLKNQIKHQTAGLIVKTREPDQADQSPEEPMDPEAALEACAQDLINAIHSKNVKQVAQVLKDAFELMESQPHAEAEHIEPQE